MSSVAAAVVQKPIARKGIKKPMPSKMAVTTMKKSKPKGVKKTVRPSNLVAREAFHKAVKSKEEAERKMMTAINKDYNKQTYAAAVNNDFVLTTSRIQKVFRDRISPSDTWIGRDEEQMFSITMQYGEKTDEQTIVLDQCIAINGIELKSVEGMTAFLMFVNKACSVQNEQNFSTLQTIMLFRFTVFCLIENVCGRAALMRAQFHEVPFVDEEVIRSKLMALL